LSAPPEYLLQDTAAVERAAADGQLEALLIDTDWRAPVADGQAGTGRVDDRGDELVRRALSGDLIIVPVHHELSTDAAGGAGPVAGVLRCWMTR